MKDNYSRKVQCAVTNFLFCGDEVLLLHRSPNKKVDANRLNGIGGRVESEENFGDASIREIEEETGYKISENDLKLCGVGRFEGGYPTDWIVCFFRVEVKDKNIPLGNETSDGKLIWMDKDKVLDSEYELVDDLNYIFKRVIQNDGVFMVSFKLNDDEKITKCTIMNLNKI